MLNSRKVSQTVSATGSPDLPNLLISPKKSGKNANLTYGAIQLLMRAYANMREVEGVVPM